MARYKLSQLKTAQQIHEEDMKDHEYRAEWERTAFARAISEMIMVYRRENGLSQTAFAKQVGLTQGNVSRLEGGDHNPNLETLAKLAQVLEIEIVVDIAPMDRERKGLSQRAKNGTLSEFTVANSQVLIAAV